MLGNFELCRPGGFCASLGTTQRPCFVHPPAIILFLSLDRFFLVRIDLLPETWHGNYIV